MNFCADMHTHTIASTHAYSTIAEICAQAAKTGLKAVAITDHGPAMPDAPHEWHFFNMRCLPREIDGVHIIRGAEANVLDERGGIDLPRANALDYVIASMHHESYKPATFTKHTEAWLGICENPDVDCLGHTGHPDFPFDYEEVVKRCRDTGTLIEINNSSKFVRKGSWENCEKILRLCKKHGVQVVVSSDAHNCWYVGTFDNSAALLDEVGFPEELVLNASWERFKTYFKIDN